MKSTEMGMNQYTTYFRELDSRIMRWTCPDPVNNYWQSPYVVMDGNPVALVDPIGAQSDGGSSGSTTFSPDGKWHMSEPILDDIGDISGSSSLTWGDVKDAMSDVADKVGAGMVWLFEHSQEAMNTNLQRSLDLAVKNYTGPAAKVTAKYKKDLGKKQFGDYEVSTEYSFSISATSSKGSDKNIEYLVSRTSVNGVVSTDKPKINSSVKVGGTSINVSTDMSSSIEQSLGNGWSYGGDISKGAFYIKYSVKKNGVTMTFKQTYNKNKDVKLDPQDEPSFATNKEWVPNINPKYIEYGTYATIGTVAVLTVVFPEVMIPVLIITAAANE